MVQTDTEDSGGSRAPTRPAGSPRDAGDYAELRERLERAVRHVAPHWMADHLDDLVQMAVMKLMRSGKASDDVELNNAFLHRVAHSVIVDELRRRKRRNETGIDPTLPEPVEPHVRADPEAMAGGQEIGAVIVEGLATLAVDRRRAVTLYLQGHSVPDAARMLDIPPKKAENLVYRGLHDLRAYLRERGLEP